MPEKVSIFINKFRNYESVYWYEVAENLKKKGYEVHDESVDCDMALILNAAFMNPSTYKNKYGFYLAMPDKHEERKLFWMTLMSTILSKYYQNGHLINFFGLTPEDASNKIIYMYRQLSNDDQNN